MSPTTFFFPINHMRNLHNPQPPVETQVPSRSFVRAGGAGLQHSLRRKASSLFPASTAMRTGEVAKEQPTSHALQPISSRKEDTKPFHELALPPMGPAAPNEGGKVKAKSRTRKVLTGLLHWGNSSNSKSKPSAPTLTISAPQPLRPAAVVPLLTQETSITQVNRHVIPPPTIRITEDDPQPAPARVLVKRSSTRLIQPNSSDSGHSSLGSIQESIPSSRSRPSMGPDPFIRSDQGAKVVKQVLRHGVTLQKLPSRSLSTEQEGCDPVGILIDEPDLKHDEPRVSCQALTSTNTSQDHDSPQARHISAPLPSKAVLSTPPPRSASLGVINAAQAAAAFESQFVPAKELHGRVAANLGDNVKTLKRQKHKSSVWGMLTRGKSRKDKPQLGIQQSASENPDSIVRHTPQLESPLKPQKHIPLEPGRARQVQGIPKTTLAASSVSIGQDPFKSQTPTNQTDIKNPMGMTLRISHTPTAGVQQPSTCGSPYVDVPPEVAPSLGHIPGMVTGSSLTTQPLHSQVQATVASGRSKGVPKRKSLAGLFGLAMKKSFIAEDTSGVPPLTTTFPDATSISWGWEVEPDVQRRLRPLLAKTEKDVGLIKPEHKESPPYRSRFGGNIEHFERNLVRGYADLRRVASATDKLSSLVSRTDFSPSPTPAGQSNLSQPQSLLAAHANANDSPTPMRRVRSEMLSTKPSTSPSHTIRTRIGPLKLVLHRAHAGASNSIKPSRSKGLISKGVRNVFSPPSPPEAASRALQPEIKQAGAPRLSLGVVSTFRMSLSNDILREQSQAKPRREHWSSATAGSAVDVPEDLLRAVGSSAHLVPATSTLPAFEWNAMLGLPPLPPAGRITPRRPARQPPAISLPPIPHLQPPLLLPSGHDDRRTSFDFTGEYAKLDRGDQRASFVEALHRVASADKLGGDKGVGFILASGLPLGEYLKMANSLDLQTNETPESVGLDHDKEFDEAKEASSVTITPPQRPSRPHPFMGQSAFREYASRVKQTHGRTISLSAPPCELAYRVPAQPRHRGHKRGESGLSIATMSSIGAVIDTGMMGDGTNYFEANFADHLRRVSNITSESDGDHSLTSAQVMATGRGHYGDRSSCQSETSDTDAELAFISGYLSTSIASSRKASSIYRHSRSGSATSSLGRTEWAVYNPRSSVSSAASDFSISRLARPGLGERMFHLDRNVQLESIAGSPSDEPIAPLRSRERSYNAVLQRSEAAYNGIVASKPLIESSCNAHAGLPRVPSRDLPASVFGSEASAAEGEVLIKGLKSISIASSASSSDDPDDTFIEIAKYAKRFTSPAKQSEPNCLHGSGEDAFALSPDQTPHLDGSADRQRLASSISRPSKPQSYHRRRPTHVKYSHPSTSTPGLTSSSASDTSSRTSLDTGIFDPFTIASDAVGHPDGNGHYRHKSSAGVKLHATIREEPSIVTLRPETEPNEHRDRSPEPEIVSWDSEDKDDEEAGGVQAMKSWIEWQREAGDEYRRIKDEWVDSEESRHAVEEFTLPTTSREIADFLAQSSEAYKPLDQLPIGRIVQRRKSCLSDIRLFTSPYGLPLPRPPQANKPKTSLITKYQRTKSSTSSNISYPGEDPPFSASPAPLSAVFAEFTREHPLSTPPKALASIPLSPLNVPKRNAIEIQRQEEVAEGDGKSGNKQGRISPEARRQALGWGRRRDSDIPIKAQKLAPDSEVFPNPGKVADKAVRVSRAAKDKENMPHTARSTRGRAKSATRAGVKLSQTQAQSLRA